MAGGESGKSITPGDATGSLLILYLKGERQPRMPQNRAPLHREDFDMIATWIKEGAKES